MGGGGGNWSSLDIRPERGRKTGRRSMAAFCGEPVCVHQLRNARARNDTIARSAKRRGKVSFRKITCMHFNSLYTVLEFLNNLWGARNRIGTELS